MGVVVTMADDIEVRLVDAPAPDGEISVKHLTALANALQDLSTRVGREVIGTTGPGRTKHFMEEFSQLRLRDIGPGSTVLLLGKGPVDKLDVDMPEYAQADKRFWEVVSAISADYRPEWVTDLVSESAERLVRALKDAAPRTVLSTSSEGAVTIESEQIHAETWTNRRQGTGTTMTARGRLEKVDLRSHEFRVRDDVGYSVDLKHVNDDVTVARLVGQWVVAQGTGALASSGRLVSLDDATVHPAEDPAAGHLGHAVANLNEILASAPGPNADGGIDLTDEEFASFLEATRA